jgi:mono/diheme cytochrome c family protein
MWLLFALLAAVDFNTQVKPILVKECATCHGAERSAGGVRLKDTVTPGKPESSMLYRTMELPKGNPKAMPPGKQLPKAQRDLIRQWIVVAGERDALRAHCGSQERTSDSTPAPRAHRGGVEGC